MKTSKLFVVSIVLTTLAVSTAAQTPANASSSNPKIDSVLVVNPVTQPVNTNIVNVAPVPVSGTVQIANPNINVVNNPNVNVTSMPAVSVNSLPAVQLAPGAKVTLEGSPLNLEARRVVRLNGRRDYAANQTGGCVDLGLLETPSSPPAGYIVPSGKRLVIEQWSGGIYVPAGQKVQLQFGANSCGGLNDQRMYLSLQTPYFDGTRDIIRGTDHGTFYVDAGDTPFWCFSRNSGTGDAIAYFYAIGHLIDCPEEGCASECP